MTRRRLPDRRPHVTREIEWNGHRIVVTVGYNPRDGSVAEVFANAETGGHMQAALSDACVVLSIALQHGISPADLGKSLLIVPAFIEGEETTAPASPLGAIVAVIEGER